MQFVIPLSKSREPLFRQVYSAVRQAVLAGTFHSGERLPSTRDLSEQLGISRTVVLLAYDQLLAEGFIEGRTGSGTYVSAVPSARGRAAVSSSPASLRLSRFGQAASRMVQKVSFPQRSSPVLPYDFIYGRSDVEVFPLETWRRMLLRNARRASLRELDYGSAAGSTALREAICNHVQRARAVVCEPSQVIVVNGSQQALDLIVRVLIARGDRAVVEDPQYQGTREILRIAGSRLLPVPVDHDGLITEKLPQRARIAFVTPSHQFPTGAILSLSRRLALLKWAERNHAAIVEDDYDGEFRYEGQRLESLQGLDQQGRVIYIGTFSRTVFPSLRIGYLIAPKSLVPALTTAKWLNDRHSATLEQKTLADFISSGMYERHLRRVRRRNTLRRAALLAAIREHLGNRVEVTGDGAGAHVVLWPRERVAEHKIIAEAASKGVGIYGVSGYFLSSRPRVGFLLGYSRMKEKDIAEGIRRLRQVF